MTYRIKLVRMLDGKRSESWLVEPGDLHGKLGSGSYYGRGAALGMARELWSRECRSDTSLVAVELVEVT